MPNGNGKYNSNDIYYKLGQVHADIKSIKNMQVNQGKQLKEQAEQLEQTTTDFNEHLIASKTRRKEKKEMKEYSYKSVGLFIGVASVIINVIIEIGKAIFK